MRSRPTALSPLLRWFTAATLLMWLGAQALCQSHCLLAACGDESDHANDRATDASHVHHDEEAPSPPGHQDGRSEPNACQTLKTALVGSGSPTLVAPHFSLLYSLDPSSLALDTIAIAPTGAFSRQGQHREFIFTPEVCLGPAFRSLAPPFIG